MASVPAEATFAGLSHATPDAPVALGRYDVVGHVGRGGMGTVYEAIDRQRGTRVALKTLGVEDAAAAVGLKREFRVVADLTHPSLAPVFELASANGVWFFTMELIDGVTLVAWARGADPDQDTYADLPLTRSYQAVAGATVTLTDDAPRVRTGASRAPEPRADGRPGAELPRHDMAAVRRTFADLAGAIAALHDAGLRHGDVKPDNVLVRRDGRAVLVDFGLSRPVGNAPPQYVSGAGTPVYMPPEQLAGKAVGPEADWYGLGASLYVVLTGRPAFAADSRLDLYLAKLHAPPVAPSALNAQIPRDLSDLAVRLLHPEPKLRPSREEIVGVLSGGGPEPQSATEPRAARRFVGREAELCRLEQAYGSARGGALTVVHTRGPSGIGKSALVESFLRAVEDVDAAIVLRGRCYERESVPYKGFDRIVDELSERLRAMDQQLLEPQLPVWTEELGRVFPALASVPAIGVRANLVPLTHDALELRRRAWAALAELLGRLGEQSAIVLVIDDLQWADRDTASLLEELLESSRGLRLLLVVLFRPVEAAANGALNGYLARAEELSREDVVVDLPIEALPGREAEQLARAALQAAGAPSGSGLVSYLVREAHGVPFFIEELAYFVGEQTPGRLESVSLDDAILARVERLPEDQRALVEVVAVANNPLPQSVVFEAAGLDAGALAALLALRNASMVRWLGAGADDAVSTYHDRIRESVDRTLTAEQRAAHHLALGRALARRRGEGLGGRVFDAVRHLAAARDAITDPAERLDAARLHLSAGSAARATAAFPLALRCFEGGIALLAEDAWTDHYDLALELHGGALEAAYLSADRPTLERRIADVKLNAKTPQDQLVAWETEIDARAGRHAYAEAIDSAVEALGMLGVALPPDPTAEELGASVRATIARLSEIGPEGLRSLPDLDDPVALAATRLQIRLSPVAYFGRPMLLPILACNLIRTSIDRGVSTATPYSLALFGIVLNTLGMYPVSHTWGQLALEMLDRFPDHRLEAATRHILHDLVCCWMVPLASTLTDLRRVFDIGVRTGDYEYASYAAHGYTHNALYAGLPLGPLTDEARQLGQQMRALGQVNAVHVHAPFEQLLGALTGALPHPWRLDGEGFDEQRALDAAEAAGSRSGLFITWLVMGLARYLFGRPVEADACFAKAEAYGDAAPSVWHQPILRQFGALAACAALEHTDDEAARLALRARVDASLGTLRELGAMAPVNFAHRAALVEAELLRIEGRADEAMAKLDEAIGLAQEGSWISDVALGNELAAGCTHEPGEAERRLRAARTGYAAWGARAKAEQLSERIARMG